MKIYQIIYSFSGADCMMTADWKSPNKITALCPSKEGSGAIIIATGSGGLGTCNVSLRIYKETLGPLKEVASWMPEKFMSRRKARRSSPTEQDDPLGLHVEERDSGKISEEQLQMMFPEFSGNIGSKRIQSIPSLTVWTIKCVIAQPSCSIACFSYAFAFYMSQNVLCRSKNLIPFSASSKPFVLAQKKRF